MKTWEMLKALSENPDAKFQTDVKGTEFTAYVSANFKGDYDVVVVSFHGRVEPLVINYGSAGLDWQPAQKPVDFITAINSGKNIMPFEDNGWVFSDASSWLRLLSGNGEMGENKIKYINGKWYVEC